MIHKYLLPLILSFLLTGCYTYVSINKKYPPSDVKQKVQVLDESKSFPTNAEEIGRIKIRHWGNSLGDHEYGYKHIIEKAKIKTQKAGGNVLKITRHKLPGFVTYYRLWAKILKVENFNDTVFTETADSSLDNANYALLNVYRYGFGGIGMGFDLHLVDSVICRVKPLSKQTIKLYKEGVYLLWAEKGGKQGMPIDIKYGMQYYIRCTQTNKGPKLELMEIKQGEWSSHHFNS